MRHLWGNTDDVIACLTYIPGVSITDWHDYDTIMKGYYAYANVYFNPGNNVRKPFNCFIQERNALLLEREAANSGITHELTPLHPKVLLLLEDLDLFTRFSIYYAVGLIAHNNVGNCFELKTSGGNVIRLCQDWDLAVLFSILLGSQPLSTQLQRDINEKVDEFLRQKPQDVVKALENADIKFYNPPPGHDDGIPRDDLKTAMNAAIQIKIREIKSRLP
jgi:hypothetical protein